jgi:regulatory protein
VAKGYGALKIRAELHQRGASSELLAKALREAEIDWFAQAERALEKKWRAGVPADNAEQKGMRFLASRGFTGEQAREAICAVLAAAANNNTDSY